MQQAWKDVFKLVESDQYKLSKRTSIRLNKAIATEEAYITVFKILIDQLATQSGYPIFNSRNS